MTEFMRAFRNEMIQRHTASQIPQRGQRREVRPEDRPIHLWNPSDTSVLRFLIETKKVHKALHAGVRSNPAAEYVRLRDLDMDTTGVIDEDITRLMLETNAVPVSFYVPGKKYADYLTRLAAEDPVLFLSHYYATFFAHASGGPLIGRRLDEVLSLSLPLQTFTKPKAGPLNDMKDHMYLLSSKWSEEDQQRTVEEVDRMFAYAGSVLRIIAQPSHPDEDEFLDM